MRTWICLWMFSAACDPDADGDGAPASVDCDDADADVNPSADEVCNDKDDDCDGLADDPSAVDAHAIYADQDDDGLGDPAGAARACFTPSGWVENRDDCDDEDPSPCP